jgi:energy-coupling factor transport system permease protein
MAMEARCYHGGEGRTKMRPLNWSRKDGIAWLVLAAYLVVMVVLKKAL